MQLFRLARHPPRWLRACLVSLVLVLALDSLAHVQHVHGHEFEGRPGVDAALCGFCIAFDRMADGPSTITFTAAPANRIVHTAVPATAAPDLRPVYRSVPRGPPAA